jgi:hypothetical protein
MQAVGAAGDCNQLFNEDAPEVVQPGFGRLVRGQSEEKDQQRAARRPMAIPFLS